MKIATRTRRALPTFTVTATRQTVAPSGGHNSDHQDFTRTVRARNRAAAAMAFRRLLEEEARQRDESTRFVLTFQTITRHGDKRPWLRLSEASGPRGADMGRFSVYPQDRNAAIKMHLRRVRLDSCGYDEGGAYWGNGAQLFWAVSAEKVPAQASNGYVYNEPKRVWLFLRAEDRKAARAELVRAIPGAKPFR